MDTLYTGHIHGFPNPNFTKFELVLTEESVLSMLVVLGSSVSLVALVFAFITYSLFSDLRNLSGITLMNLLAALIMTQLLYVVGVGGVPDPEVCIALAFALQYSRLCTFCWMLLITHHMYNQFQTGLHLVPVIDNHITKNFFRYSLLGWGLPIFLLIGSVLIEYHEKAGKLLDTGSISAQNCWFLDKNAFIYGLLVPCGIIILTAFYYLIRSTILSRYIICTQTDLRMRKKMNKKRSLQLLLFSKITIVLSIVIALAALAKFYEKSEPLRISYHMTQGSQGILIAMLVTCNCEVLKLYTKSIKSRASKHIDSYVYKGNGNFLRKSTSLQMLTSDNLPETV